ncbi:hypothetical protein B7P43_G04601 [Cryptotermes secundus]|uniref:Uncharacterized protein n=1 Tax=Cryptotermes secundus TaxID=105785 RepID=A0A2J7PI76_9NEOP|nr:hypothetical protein B7P43_G04601 [Cryptotermes secundus]
MIGVNKKSTHNIRRKKKKKKKEVGTCDERAYLMKARAKGAGGARDGSDQLFLLAPGRPTQRKTANDYIRVVRPRVPAFGKPLQNQYLLFIM